MSLLKFLDTRKQTERLCKPLYVEDYVPQAVEFASPPKWHLAHVSWFFEEMILKNYLNNYPVFNEDFGFDNELAMHKVYLNDYQVSKALVTNGEFIEFLEDGGYQKFQYWLDEA